MSDCPACGKPAYESEWCGPLNCKGCDRETRECNCPPQLGYPLIAKLDEYGEVAISPLLSRLLPGGCILDVPAVPGAVWATGKISSGPRGSP